MKMKNPFVEKIDKKQTTASLIEILFDSHRFFKRFIDQIYSTGLAARAAERYEPTTFPCLFLPSSSDTQVLRTVHVFSGMGWPLAELDNAPMVATGVQLLWVAWPTQRLILLVNLLSILFSWQNTLYLQIFFRLTQDVLDYYSQKRAWNCFATGQPL